MLTAIGTATRKWVDGKEPWTNVVGVARTILAGATLTTLLFNRASILFRPVAGVSQSPMCNSVRTVSAFCTVAPTHLELVRWLAIAGLALVASGWRPRYTGVLHWWITWSLQASAATLDGGDQVAAILALLLIPVTLTDDRRWHWEVRIPTLPGERETAKRLLASMSLTLVRLQVAIIYLHACIGKAYSPEWQDGTALYYWLQHPDFGAPGWLEVILRPILLHATSVALMTWSVMLVEIGLAAGLFMDRRFWPALLVSGLLLHGGIILAHGLVSFGSIMMAALILYLRPSEERFDVAAPVRRLSARLRAFRALSSAPLESLTPEVIGGE